MPMPPFDANDRFVMKYDGAARTPASAFRAAPGRSRPGSSIMCMVHMQVASGSHRWKCVQSTVDTAVAALTPVMRCLLFPDDGATGKEDCWVDGSEDVAKSSRGGMPSSMLSFRVGGAGGM